MLGAKLWVAASTKLLNYIPIQISRLLPWLTDMSLLKKLYFFGGGCSLHMYEYIGDLFPRNAKTASEDPYIVNT